MSMHYVRRRCSCAAAPFGGYIDTRQRPPVDEIYPAGIDEEMSSEATVLLQDSEPEDELQSFLYDHSGHLLDSRLREQSYRMGNVQNSFDSFSTAATVPLQHPAMNVQLSPEALQREMFRRRRGPALSWGFQQEVADYEASLQNGAKSGGMMYHHPTTPCIMRSDQSLAFKQPRRRSKCELKDQRMDVSMATMNERKVVNQRPKQKTRRRGRRGGRGRKHSERQSDDVPKLEQNLEDELAKEMASHMSSKSALAHSFSSLRLHVAGGGTMIILNDKEITGGQSNHSKQNRREEPTVRVDVYSSKEDDIDMHRLEGGPRVIRPKGCGAFFPPQVLQQLQGETQSMYNPSLSHPSTPSALNIKAMPYTPSESAPSTERTTMQSSRAKPGTGCFIPAYSQDIPSPEIDSSKVLESVSLVESLACLEDSEEQHLSPEASADLFDAGDMCSEISMSMIEKGTKGRSIEDGPSSGHDQGHDLMHLIETDDYTTFTSPLHMDETLSLQAEREAHEETEQKLINLQIENEELRSTIRDQRELEEQLLRMKENNAALQMMLMIQLNNQRKHNLRILTPLGISIKKENIPEDNSASKIEDGPDPVKEIKRSKGQIRGVVHQPIENRRSTKKSNMKLEISDDQSVRPVSLMEASKKTQVKGRPQSFENVEAKRNKKTGLNKVTTRQSRAASSLRP